MYGQSSLQELKEVLCSRPRFKVQYYHTTKQLYSIMRLFFFFCLDTSKFCLAYQTFLPQKPPLGN